MFPVALALLFTSCFGAAAQTASSGRSASAVSDIEVPAAPDYADTAQFWYMPGYNAGLRYAADVIYIYPTTGTEPCDAEGEPSDYSDPRDSAERAPVTLDMRVKRELYADSTFNYFSPYYRQMTMNVYQEGNFTDRADIPEDDVRRAFRYYMDHLNGGRPFILLGHSQGSQHIVALIKKELSREELGRMIAAYCIGWKITRQELEEYPDRLRPAKGETDTGCIVMFNSVTDPASQSALLRGSCVCINPLNWKTDSTLAPKELHKGFRRWRSSKGAYQVVEHYTGAYRKGGCLICPDANPADIYIESLKDVFPWGNLHCMDSWLYSENLRDNMRLRAQAWFSARDGH